MIVTTACVCQNVYFICSVKTNSYIIKKKQNCLESGISSTVLIHTDKQVGERMSWMEEEGEGGCAYVEEASKVLKDDRWDIQ